MKALCLLSLGLLAAAPLSAGAQSFSQLSESMGPDLSAPPAPRLAPVQEETSGQEGSQQDVDFLVRPEAEHEPGAKLFNPWRMAEKSVPDMDKTPQIPFLELAKAEAKANEIDLALVLAVIQKESSFDPKARSSVGAVGLMQLMPATAKWLGMKKKEQLTTPAVNIKYGVKYLKYLWDKFSDIPSGDISPEGMKQRTAQMAIAAYNAGQGNVRKYNDVPPFKETRSYVKKVTEYFNYYSGLL